MEVPQNMQENVDYFATEPDVNFEANVLDLMEIKLEHVKVEPHLPESDNLHLKFNLAEETQMIEHNDDNSSDFFRPSNAWPGLLVVNKDENLDENVGSKIVELRTKFNPELCAEETTKWIKQYSTATKTNWIVKKNYKEPKRYLYRKDFICQHSSKNKVKHQSLSKRNKDCKMQINVWVRINTANTRKSDKLMRSGLNATIKIIGEHSHKIHVAEAYSYLRVSNETNALFINYFNNGLGPAESKMYHENNLIVDSNKNDILKSLSDAQINPTDRHIYYLYEKWRKENYGSESISSTIDLIKAKIPAYEEIGVMISVEESPMTICLVTPIMKRAHNNKFAAEIIFVDSTASCDESGASITFFIAGTKIGGIPLGCIIHNGQTENDYFNAFVAFKKLLGDSGFNGKGEPNVFMIDDSTPERMALNRVFPSSKLLLCSFHICQAAWRWLWDQKNNIVQLDRKPLMLIIREILYAVNVTDCDELIDRAFENDLVKEYPQFSKYLESLTRRKNEWCIAYCKDGLTGGHNTNNLVEASIRVFKDIVLKRCKAFKPVALAEFVIKVLDKHHQRRIQKYASFQVSKPELDYQKFCIEGALLKVERIETNLFHVSSATDLKVVYTVHSELGLCECPAGIGGAFCKHLCAVHMEYSAQISESPSLSFEDRVTFAKIALGDNIDDFFFQNMSLENDNDNTKNTLSESTEFLNPMVENEEHELDEISLPETDIEADGENAQEIDRLSENFIKITNMAKLHCNSHMMKTLTQFNDRLENIETSSQLLAFFESYLAKYKHGNRNKIKVEPMAIARRRFSYKGSTSLQAGRIKKTRRKKRQRKLFENILAN